MRFIEPIKKFFIPSKGNDFKPNSLRRDSVVALLSLILLIELAYLAQVFIVTNKTDFLALVLPGALTSLTNEERYENNITPLSSSSLLEHAAQLKAEDMATRGYFSHTSPDGKLPWYWMERVGYSYKYAGENLAINFFDSKDVAEAWSKSPTHRGNVLKKEFTEIGIGVANGVYEGKDPVFVVQFFGTPIDQAIPPISTLTTSKIPSSTPAVSIVQPVETRILGEETVNLSVNKPGVMNILKETVTSPRKMSLYAYELLGLFVVLLLILAVFIRMEIQHLPLVYRGIALLVILILLSFFNMGIPPKLNVDPPDNGMNANVIASLP